MRSLEQRCTNKRDVPQVNVQRMQRVLEESLRTPTPVVVHSSETSFGECTIDDDFLREYVPREDRLQSRKQEKPSKTTPTKRGRQAPKRKAPARVTTPDVVLLDETLTAPAAKVIKVATSAAVE